MHSIVQDKEALEGFATGRMKLEFASGKSWIVQSLPDEELLESLAARVRPMLLQREPTHYARVLGALKLFAGSDETIVSAIAGLKPLWHRLRSDNATLLAWTAQVITPPGAPVENLTDLQLAYAWLYGDVVHGDRVRLAEARSFGLDERYRAAVLVVGNAAQLTLWTLNTLRNMRARKLVNIDDSYFTEAVSIQSREYRHEVAASIGQPGATPPDPGEPFGPEWTQLGDPDPS